MKGDHYNQYMNMNMNMNTSTSTRTSKENESNNQNNWWTWDRASTCVHRSPPANNNNNSNNDDDGMSGGKSRQRRRVILSFDLAAGEDDREWYQYGQKREWRSGMTQRKSKLVA